MLSYAEWINESIEKLKKVYGKRKRLGTLDSAISFMPKRKVSHSFRVGATVAKAGLPRKFVDAAVLHDYLERGGDPALIAKLGLSKRAVQIINLLSIDEKIPGMDDNSIVYHHVQTMLQDQELDRKTKNIAIVIKCSDRLDNITKRVKIRRLTRDYWDKSMRLLQLLISSYNGKPKWLKYILKKLRILQAQVEKVGFRVPKRQRGMTFNISPVPTV